MRLHFSSDLITFLSVSMNSNFCKLTRELSLLHLNSKPRRKVKMNKLFMLFYFIQVGIDVAYKVTKYFLEVFGERISAGDPRVIEELVESGCLGRKSGKG